MDTIRVKGYEKGHVMLETSPQAEPGEREVLVETLYSTISPGTELAWLNHFTNTPGEYPYYPGYSCCGRVAAKGEGVRRLAVGDLVAARSIHCSAFTAAEESCFPIRRISPRAASAYRLASISLQGIRKADLQIGDRAAVLGLGPIGNLAAQLAYVAGAEVTGFDPVEWRRRLARGCGVERAEADAENGGYENCFDVVIEATGRPAVINSALHIVRPMGTVILLGSPRGLTDGVNFYRDVHRKGVSIVGAHESLRSESPNDRFGHFRSNGQDEETVIRLLESGRIVTEPLISETVDPGSAQEIYDRLLAGREELMLAAFRWKEE